MRALVLVALVGCAHGTTRVGVRAAELVQHAGELGRDGRTDVDTVVVMPGQTSPGTRETVFAGQTVQLRGRTTSLTELLAGCDGTAPCPLAAHPDDVIVLRTIEAGPAPASKVSERTAASYVFGGLTLGSLTGMTVCLVICESNKAAKSIALGGGGLVFLVLAALAGGAHD